MRVGKGAIISFSGIDGAGKSTQIEFLLTYLNEIGQKPIYYWSRGGYTKPFNSLKGFIRKILGKKVPPSGHSIQREQALGKPWIRDLWLSLAIIDLLLIYGIYFRLLKFIGRVVIADRYISDTLIDFYLNFPSVDIDKRFIWKSLARLAPVPDIQFMLLIPVNESLKRSKLKSEPFPDSEETLKQRIQFYQLISAKERYKNVDCLQSIQSVKEQILRYIKEIGTT